MAYNIDVVADALLNASRERRIEVSNLKLQKLMYYAQGWYLVLTSQPLYSEDIQAWVHGPVIPCLFHRFKPYKWGAIDEKGKQGNPVLHRYLGMLLEKYGRYSAKELEQFTHNERPWIDARAGLAVDEPSTRVITQEALRAHFSALMQASAAK
ncbi:type II toxin-antitoxin system antitoxin SocA domain-containing protein [Acidobacterium sp.]|nr:type II toxin-antitoxin system antitoxin SocA domain-containing protein [Acidobacterium sp.]